ncbi:permuted papain-like amidase YaeF/Yiix C92 family enzyme [Taibaiella chishuiensis]|uniref:Permuted papain-like amidase YaeF/Yiix C92 family enzyme n=2 Tax=Taibaiella chishuiensis TaxID=1434707 RepID=A0A2P8CYW3_9BACT|nr:permuted papain-like amidase YaeF/Yiix C92 family enzyme [Taibaiella chishuiensis]
MDSTHGNKNRKLHGALLIAMLVVFLVVYNRKLLMDWYDPQPAAVVHTPNMRRAANPWNRYHADSCIQIVKDGDLVLRSGSDAISALFKKVNTRDKSYSHAGIVFIENGYPMVYNLIGNAEDPEAVLRRDSLSAFISPHDNTAYAVYRYKLSRQQVEKLHDLSIRYFKEKRRFDPHFDLATDSSLYCTEFVYKAMIEVTGDKKYLGTTQTANFSFVSVDNLFLKKGIKLVCKIVYIQ